MPRRAFLILRLALAVAALAVLAVPRPAWACSCAMPAGPDVAFDQAAAVFTGSVTSNSLLNGPTLYDWLLQLTGQATRLGFPDVVRVTLAVTTAWKGATVTPVVVGTGFGGGDCGFSFAVGRDYLVYAYGTNATGHLTTNICTRTAEVSQAAQDLAYLQTQPTLAVTPAPAQVPWLGLGAGVCGLAVVGLAVGAFAVVRRRAKVSKAS